MGEVRRGAHRTQSPSSGPPSIKRGELSTVFLDKKATIQYRMPLNFFRGGVAQLVEQGNHNPCVRGSSPCTATIFPFPFLIRILRYNCWYNFYETSNTAFREQPHFLRNHAACKG